jgi:hypothetical protein
MNAQAIESYLTQWNVPDNNKSGLNSEFMVLV